MKTLWSKFWFRWAVWLIFIIAICYAVSLAIQHANLSFMLIVVTIGIGLIAWDIAKVTK